MQPLLIAAGFSAILAMMINFLGGGGVFMFGFIMSFVILAPCLVIGFAKEEREAKAAAASLAAARAEADRKKSAWENAVNGVQRELTAQGVNTNLVLKSYGVAGVICIDEVKCLLGLASIADSKAPDVAVVRASDVLSSEVVVDNGTTRTTSTSTATAKTATGNMLVRGVVGNVAFGPLGGVAGAVTAKKTTTEHGEARTTEFVRRVELRLQLRNPRFPQFVVEFARDVAKDSDQFDRALAMARQWRASVEAMRATTPSV